MKLDSRHFSKKAYTALTSLAHIYITIDQNLKHSKNVSDWENKGNTPEVRGKALNLLYGNNNFKGVNRDGIGNSDVGGAFGTPSFVIIKSNFPNQSDNYQAVTIFGVNNKARAKFVQALGTDYIRVW